jgi:uncharacterized membrane protein
MQTLSARSAMIKQIWAFVKTTILGGVIFILPIAATAVVVVKAGRMAFETAAPLAEKLPFPKGEAVIAVYGLGTIVLALVAFAAGIYAQSLPIEKKAMPFLEDRILKKFPPYAAALKYTDRLARIESNKELKPVLARLVNSWQIAFLVEAYGDDHVCVFVPGAPDPASGTVHVVSRENIAPFNASRQEALVCLEKSGQGFSRFL